MERYEDFWSVTEAALRWAVKQLSIEMTDSQINMLMQAYLAPATFVDVSTALEAFNGIPLAILSNGSPEMLDSAVRCNGLESNFTEIISVDRVKTYKPSPRVYALGPEILGIPAGEILFVSSNFWDAAGAKAYGYQVCWCNRSHIEMDPRWTPENRPSMDTSKPANGAKPGQSIYTASASSFQEQLSRPGLY